MPGEKGPGLTRMQTQTLTWAGRHTENCKHIKAYRHKHRTTYTTRSHRHFKNKDRHRHTGTQTRATKTRADRCAETHRRRCGQADTDIRTPSQSGSLPPNGPSIPEQQWVAASAAGSLSGFGWVAPAPLISSTHSPQSPSPNSFPCPLSYSLWALIPPPFQASNSSTILLLLLLPAAWVGG